jgi:hypothetical protein
MKPPLLVPNDTVYCCSSALLFSPWLKAMSNQHISLKEKKRGLAKKNYVAEQKVFLANEETCLLH